MITTSTCSVICLSFLLLKRCSEIATGQSSLHFAWNLAPARDATTFPPQKPIWTNYYLYPAQHKRPMLRLSPGKVGYRRCKPALTRNTQAKQHTSPFLWHFFNRLLCFLR